MRSVANCPARCHGWRGGATHGVIFLSLATPRSAGSARSRRTPLMPPPGETAPSASALAESPRPTRRLFDIGRFNEAPGKGDLAPPPQLAPRARGFPDRQMRIGTPAGVGIGDGDAATLLP